MIDYDKQLVTELSTILPTHFELFVNSKTATPCITYIPLTDSAYKEGETLRYGKLTYTIKLWGNDLSVLNPYKQLVDNKMYALGFKRLSENILTYNQNLQIILHYEGITWETGNFK